MLPAIAPLTRTLAPMAENTVKNVAQDAGQHLAAETVSQMTTDKSPTSAVSYGSDHAESKAVSF